MKLAILPCLVLATLGVGALKATAALADEASNATGICQGVLPAADSQIRKRPLAVRNEGTATAFVSCSMPVNFAGPNFLVDAYFVNRSAATITVSCTLVDGSVGELGEEPGYYPLSIELGTGTTGILEWSAPDFSLSTFSTTANLSCALPPGVEIARVAVSE